MLLNEFEKVMEEQFDKCRKLLSLKAEEYAGERDRLEEFKQSAMLLGTSSIQSLAGKMVKHTSSIYKLIRQERNGIAWNMKVWDEKITDHINYLILLKALLVEKPVQVHGVFETNSIQKMKEVDDDSKNLRKTLR